jgi:2-polyprenyl-3-methyl-5-hydroxy-6-metoxy-1,4-benzoquinol methylase
MNQMLSHRPEDRLIMDTARRNSEMITNPQEMRALLHDFSVSTWAVAAVGALFESGAVDHLREPCSADDLARACRSLSRSRLEHCLEVASVFGVVVRDGGRYRLSEGALPFVAQPMRAVIQGEIRSHLMQPLAFLDSSGAGSPRAGWDHTDRALLQAQGDASGALPPMLKAQIVPTLGDLAARLEGPGARLLDVGVGVASLAISACRAWPGIRVVGLDTSDAPLAIARDNVARADLGERIELRKLAVEDLRDEETFDLAWFPSFFIPQAAMAAAVARVRAALRPGGWVITAVLGGADERQRAVGGLLTDLWGGPVMSPAEMQGVFSSAGFSTTRILPGPLWAPALIAAQR